MTQERHYIWQLPSWLKDGDVLEARFEAVPKSMISKIKKINDTAVLKMLHKNAIFVGSLQEFKEIMG